jgi:hypothetical protein
LQDRIDKFYHLCTIHRTNSGGKATNSQKRRKTNKRRGGAKLAAGQKICSFPDNINNSRDTPKGAPLQNRGRKLSLQKCKIGGMLSVFEI